MELSLAALAFRAGHTVIVIERLLAIAYVWWCALTGRDRSTTHRPGDAADRRRTRCRQPRRLPAGRTAATSWRSRPALRAGTVAAQRTVGRADAGRHHHRWACPVGGMRSPRQALNRYLSYGFAVPPARAGSLSPLSSRVRGSPVLPTSPRGGYRKYARPRLGGGILSRR